MVSNKTYNNVVNTLCRIGQYHYTNSFSFSWRYIRHKLRKDAEVSFVAHQPNFSTDWG
jgi:hypothetical protein